MPDLMHTQNVWWSNPVASLIPPNILIADDDPELRALICGIFRQRGHDVVAFRHGRALLAHINSERAGGVHRSGPSEIVISDVMMPGLSGLELLRRLRSTGCYTPVILISAWDDESIRSEIERQEAAAFLVKPIDERLLIRAVASMETV